MADNAVFTGKEKLARKMAMLPEAFREIVTREMGKAADDVVAMMKRLAPVDRGDLRESIGWTFGDPPKGSIVVFKSRPVRGLNMKLTIFAGNDKAFYARWVEFGTLAHPQGGKFKGAEHPGTAAHPFFYPAYRFHKKKIKGRVSRALNTEAKRIAAR